MMEPIRIERQPRKSGGPRKVLVLLCAYPDCKEEIKRRPSELKNRSFYCSTHSHIKRPFESIYNGLFNDWRKTPVNLSYEEFLKFTEIKQCHYCLDPISWIEYSTVKGEYKSRSYFLDRKDNNGPYSVENCVVCCTRCNKSRASYFSYEDWYGMTEYLRKKRNDS